MNKKNKNILASALVGALSVGIIVGGYSILNKKITLVVDGKSQEISTFKSSVEEILAEKNVSYDGNDIVTAKLDSKLSDGMKIEVIDVKEETIKEYKEIPYDTEVVEDRNLLKGDTKVAQEGQNGKNELVYKITYHNGEQVDRQFINEIISIESKNKIVKKGTKTEVKVASSRGESTRGNTSSGSNNSNRKHMKVVATAYTGDGITSTGTKPKWGTISVDPSVIPYGTKVYIPQFDMTFVAEDTGGAIKGNKIDIFMNDETSVYNWGRKTIDIYIIG